jgi:hypothetical protein
MALQKIPVRDYFGATIEGAAIRDCRFGESATFENCVFSHCLFERVVFVKSSMNAVGFLACRFIDCATEENANDNTVGSAWALGCVSMPEQPDILSSLNDKKTEVDSVIEESIDYEKLVLEQFWQKGKAMASIRRKVNTLFHGFRPEERAIVAEAIQNLKRLEYIEIRGDMAELLLDRIDEIKVKLGRE